MTRYTIGTVPEEPDEIIVCDHKTHHIILRGGKMGLPDVQELLRLANTAQAWRDSPTVPGHWVLNSRPARVVRVLDHELDSIHDQWKGFRWFGPIPEDVG